MRLGMAGVGAEGRFEMLARGGIFADFVQDIAQVHVAHGVVRMARHGLRVSGARGGAISRGVEQRAQIVERQAMRGIARQHVDIGVSRFQGAPQFRQQSGALESQAHAKLINTGGIDTGAGTRGIDTGPHTGGIDNGAGTRRIDTGDHTNGIGTGAHARGIDASAHTRGAQAAGAFDHAGGHQGSDAGVQLAERLFARALRRPIRVSRLPRCVARRRAGFHGASQGHRFFHQQVDLFLAGAVIHEGRADGQTPVEDGGGWRHRAGLLQLDRDPRIDALRALRAVAEADHVEFHRRQQFQLRRDGDAGFQVAGRARRCAKSPRPAPRCRTP